MSTARASWGSINEVVIEEEAVRPRRKTVGTPSLSSHGNGHDRRKMSGAAEERRHGRDELTALLETQFDGLARGEDAGIVAFAPVLEGGLKHPLAFGREAPGVHQMLAKRSDDTRVLDRLMSCASSAAVAA